MTKDKLKDDVIRTICCLNSDISNKDRELLIKLFNSIYSTFKVFFLILCCKNTFTSININYTTFF